MKRRRLAVLLLAIGFTCIAGAILFFALTDRSVLAPFAGVAAMIAVTCGLLPVWMQHR